MTALEYACKNGYDEAIGILVGKTDPMQLVEAKEHVSLPVHYLLRQKLEREKLFIQMMDRVKDSPKLARRAMTKMTSTMVSRKQKKDELYIITLDVVHSSGVVGRGDRRADAW